MITNNNDWEEDDWEEVEEIELAKKIRWFYFIKRN